MPPLTTNASPTQYNINVGMGRTSLNSSGMVNCGYGCDPERVDEVLGLLRAELEEFVATGPTEVSWGGGGIGGSPLTRDLPFHRRRRAL